MIKAPSFVKINNFSSHVSKATKIFVKKDLLTFFFLLYFLIDFESQKLKIENDQVIIIIFYHFPSHKVKSLRNRVRKFLFFCHPLQESKFYHKYYSFFFSGRVTRILLQQGLL